MDRLYISPCMGSNMGLSTCIGNEKWLEARMSLWAAPELNAEYMERLKALSEWYLDEIAVRANGSY